jgi:hypothetical protein
LARGKNGGPLGISRMGSLREMPSGVRLHGAFVGGGAVDRRDEDVVEAQIDCELAAMVDKVIEDPGADGGDARHGEHLLTVVQEAPGLVEIGVGSAGDGGAGRRKRFVEDF